MLFLDLGNISRALDTKALGGFRLDWFRLAKHLTGQRRLVGAYAFDTSPDPAPHSAKQRFHDHLRYSGFRVVTRPYRPDDRAVFAEVQIALASELMAHAMADHFDVAVIVSGDRAFAPAMERVGREGKSVEIATTQAMLTGDLRKVADRVQFLDELPILEIMPEAPAEDYDYEEEVAA